MDCIKCQEEIPQGRLVILPDTRTCVQCSTAGKWYARPVITGKTTYSEVEIIKDEDTAAEMKRYDASGRTGFGSSISRVKR
jgi:hypothetical protein